MGSACIAGPVSSACVLQSARGLPGEGRCSGSGGLTAAGAAPSTAWTLALYSPLLALSGPRPSRTIKIIALRLLTPGGRVLPVQGPVAMLFGGRVSGHWAICPHSWQYRGRQHRRATASSPNVSMGHSLSCVTHVPEMAPTVRLCLHKHGAL